MAIKKKVRSNDDDFEKEMEEEAERESAREKSGGGGGNRISIKGRRFTLNDAKLGREMKVVVLEAIYANEKYDGKYREDKASIPACYAFSTDGEDMAPHEDAPSPKADACEGCEFNEWGSGGGRRKACKQGRHVAVIHVDDLEDIENAEIATLNIPPASAKNWGSHVKEVKAKLSRPFYGIVTEVSFDMDADYPTLLFNSDEKLDREQVTAIKERRAEALETLMTPYDASSFEERGDDDDDDEDDDEDETPVKKKKKAVVAAKKAAPKKKLSMARDDDDDDDDDEEEDEQVKKKPVKKVVKKSVKSRAQEDDDDEDDESEDDEEDDDDDEDAKPVVKARAATKKKPVRKAPPKRAASADDDDDADDDEEEDDEEDAKPVKGGKSRFGKR